MERKYYLRGLGLGIAVTAVIMGIALSGNGAMTNDEIIARAKELGMVENTVLSSAGSEDVVQGNANDEDADLPSVQDDVDDVQAQDVESTKQDETHNTLTEENNDEEEDSEQEAEPETDIEPEQSEAEDPEEFDEPDVGVGEEKSGTVSLGEPESAHHTENSNELITSATVKTIVIKSGDSSYTVAKKLEDVGIVASASTFDTFLCQNGYDKRLHTGTFSIPADASDEQIARIVTGME